MTTRNTTHLPHSRSQLYYMITAMLTFVTVVILTACKGSSPDGGGGSNSLVVGIDSPADSAVVHGATLLKVSVTGGSGGVAVKFFIDGSLVSTDSSTPYEYSWNATSLSNGSAHTFRAVAADNAGSADTSATRTYFANYAPLRLTVQSPNNGDVIPTGQAFAATVSGGAGGSVVSFIVDNVTLLVDSSSPYQCAWNVGALPSGSSHTVQITAADTAGQSTSSSVRTVYARFAPLVFSLPFPPDSAVIGETRSFNGQILGGSGSYHVQYFVDSSLALDDSVAPYALSWDPSTYTLGSSHTIYAVCADTSGQADTLSTRLIWALWRPIVTSSGTTLPHNVRRIFGRSNSSWAEFRVEFDNNWTDYKNIALGIDIGVFFDIDQNSSTGTNVTFSGTQTIGDIGADRKCQFGYHGDSSGVWSGSAWTVTGFDGNFKIAGSTNVLEFGVTLSNLNFPTAINLDAFNVHFTSLNPVVYQSEWIPALGHATLRIDQHYYGPLIVP